MSYPSKQPICKLLIAFYLLCFHCLVLATNQRASGKLVTLDIDSKALTGNLLGINPKRKVLVYLPRTYYQANKPFPVVYYFHNFRWSNEQLFGEGNELKKLLDEAIHQGRLDEVIVVAGDFRTSSIGTFYSNHPASGRWLRHIKNELIPAVDKKFTTLSRAKGRIATGDYIGGYAAIKLAMTYPNTFGAVYAMHPIGTHTGETLIHARPDWRQLNSATSWEQIQANPYNSIFMSMAQAFLPNPKNPPFYADLMVELHDNQLKVNADNVRTLKKNFLLAENVPEKASSLQRLLSFKIDWGRLDANPDHVYANRKFTRLLSEYGVEHEAEEFNGGPWDRYWGNDGRVVSELFPFINRFIDKANQTSAD